jgi:hypothetical protein
MTMLPLCFNRRALLGAAAAMIAAGRAPAEEPLGAEEMRLLVEHGRYLPLLQFTRSMAAANTSMAWMAAQISAMAGDEDAAFNIPAATPLPLRDLTGCFAADAVETIAQAARTRRVVILNEAHNISRCRAFAGVVASRLRQEGFTVFAAETFDNATAAAIGSLNAGAPITPALGWYMADPVYAETVRAARRKGFRFAAYEAKSKQMAGAAPAQQIETREDAEANNFIANILTRDPKARVFVTCGYDHVRKTPDANGQMWFAARLKAKTGIDPLCVSQDWSVPPSDPVPEPPALMAILDDFTPAAPVVVFDRAKAPLHVARPQGSVDIEVIHPRLRPVDGRPGWLARLPGRKRASFALAAAAQASDLIQAIPAGETRAAGAVPSDQYPLKEGAREAVFFLTAGTYEIRLETSDGRSVLGQIKV